MYGIKRNGIELKIHSLEKNKPYIWIESDNNSVFVGKLKDDKSAEILKKTIDFVCFGNGEDELRKILGVENGVV